MSLLSERLEAALSKRGITNLAEFGRRVGTTRATVGNWLHGHSLEIKGDRLLIVAKELGVTPEWLSRGNHLKIEWVDESIRDYKEPRSPLPISDLLDEVSSLVHRAAPEVRSEVARLILRYAENPKAGKGIAKAIEALTSIET